MKNHQNIKEELIELTRKLAYKVIDVMREIDEYQWGKYEIREFRSNVGYYTTLCISNRSLLDVEQEYYLHNDFSIRIVGASVIEAMEFISDVPELLADIQKRKEEKTTAMSTCLDIAKMILSE